MRSTRPKRRKHVVVLGSVWFVPACGLEALAQGRKVNPQDRQQRADHLVREQRLEQFCAQHLGTAVSSASAATDSQIRRGRGVSPTAIASSTSITRGGTAPRWC